MWITREFSEHKLIREFIIPSYFRQQSILHISFIFFSNWDSKFLEIYFIKSSISRPWAFQRKRGCPFVASQRRSRSSQSRFPENIIFFLTFRVIFSSFNIFFYFHCIKSSREIWIFWFVLTNRFFLQVLCEGNGDSQLPVSFSIELVCSNKARAGLKKYFSSQKSEFWDNSCLITMQKG